MTDHDAEASAFTFHGTWREYAPIAFTNLLLTIVTLGLYNFWARARTRRYLWSRTRFIDDRLEWTGTGLELFIGYVLAIVLFVVPLGIINFGLQGLVLRGHPGAAGLTFIALYLLVLFMVGVARFRALRYRLSRTLWHGIRGGSDEQGFAFGGQYLWRTIVGALPAGLLVPWSMTSLWNRRWSRMSYGSLHFTADAESGGLIGRYLLFYLAPILLFGAGIFAGLAGAGRGGAGIAPPLTTFAIATALFVVIFYGLLGAIALAFFAAFFRVAIGSTALGPLTLGFTARTLDWIKLMLGNVGLVLVTLGVGTIFVPYRNWAFFVRHLEFYGELDLAAFTQSSTRVPGQGEGLLDAFDVGAF